MKFKILRKRLGHISVQRNILVSVCALLLVTTALQALFLFFKTERTILVPLESRQGYWVQGNRFSSVYLEELGQYFCHLLLDVTETNILLQGNTVLAYVDPSMHGIFRTRLLEDEKKLKAQQVSLQFFPKSVEVFPDQHTVHVTGELMSYVGAKRVSQAQETYRVVFTPKMGKLFLQSFETIKTNTGELNHAS
jgi:conjugal transfer pilus assembly protein TraE